jgi:hypothetical protein
LLIPQGLACLCWLLYRNFFFLSLFSNHKIFWKLNLTQN